MREHITKVLLQREHVFNLTSEKLSDDEYLLLSKGLKFIPTPLIKNSKTLLMRDFNEFARKLKCKFLFQKTAEDNKIHPFRTNSGFDPKNHVEPIQTYIDKTKLELSSIQTQNINDNLSASERRCLKDLKSRKDIIIKKADKNNMRVIMHKSDYIKEGERQLNSKYYSHQPKFELQDLVNLIQDKLSDMKIKGVLDDTTYNFLQPKQFNARLGRLYFLPKIHKIDIDVFHEIKRNGCCKSSISPPGRPIISQIGTPTEKISQYVDYFLTPIVHTLSTFIRDSSDFITKIESFKPNNDCLLVSYDVTSLYTNTQFEELISATETYYSEADKSVYAIKAPSTGDLSFLLRLILENNLFEFNSKIYKQIIGCAMGSKCSPSVCDIRLHQITREIINTFPNKHHITYHGRYRDDGFIIFHGEGKEIHELFTIANSTHPLLKFTYELSRNEMHFLDTTVYKGKRFAATRTLDFKTYIKPTNTFQYLERKSAHNPSVFKGFIKAETIRYIRSTNDEDVLQENLSNFRRNLLRRGYSETEINQNIQAVLDNYDRDALLSDKNKKQGIPLVFVTKYNPGIRKIKQKLVKYWHILQRDKDVFSELPIVAYKRNKNLGDLLTSSVIK